MISFVRKFRRWLCQINKHNWRHTTEWRTVKATVWGTTWPWGATFQVKVKTCKRCGLRIESDTRNEIRIEDEWDMSPEHSNIKL